MIRLLLLIALFAGPSAAAAKKEKRSELSVAACKKGCMATHDAKVIACKTVLSKEGDRCTDKAVAERKDCESSCEKPRKKKRR